jgi:predicted nucleic-acid-binding protein
LLAQKFNNPQADSRQSRYEDWGQNELHVDAGRRCHHASKKQAYGRTCGAVAQKRQETFAHRATFTLMLGVDTNVLVRYLTRDDKSQYERARRLIDREPAKGEPVLVSLLVLVSMLVLLETEWVLRSRYQLAKEDIVMALSALLDSADLALEDEPSVKNAVYSWKDSAADFADCLIEARNRRQGCRATATFDGRALKVPGFISV